jgi:putative mRNA 3-end processing factor
LQIKFLGGAREVGRMGIAVKSEKTQVLVDYGVMLGDQIGFPMHVPPKEIDAILLTHSHLDHSGATPLFYVHGKKPLYTNILNMELTQLLVQDLIHHSSYMLPFEYLELKTMVSSNIHLDYGSKEALGEMNFKLLNAGHTPGSSQVLIEAEGKRFLYTGDFNTTDSKLLKGANLKEYADLDCLVIESTYAKDEHPERSVVEEEFITAATEIVETGGTVLVPAFGVGRAQEIACVLFDHHFKYPVYLDGMAREVSRIMMNHGEYLRNLKLFKNAINSAEWIQGWRDRRRAVSSPGIIISPSGMLKGGPSQFYVSKIGKKSNNAIFLVSFQVPGTPGQILLDTGMTTIDGVARKIKASVRKFDFSPHCGASQLRDALGKLGGHPKVFVVHGAEGNCELLAEWAKTELNLDAVAPRTGETFKI